MAIGANSYGSVAEVVALTRHLMDGNASFSSTTRPTLTEVEAMIDRASAILNSALSGSGFTVPVTQADVKLALDDWVIMETARRVELTQRGTGWTDQGNERIGKLKMDDVVDFVETNARGWADLGAARDVAGSEGFNYTALTVQSQRTDQDVTSREQPRFKRRQFDR